jgi:hypothetical protein
VLVDAKARQELGYRPGISVDEALAVLAEAGALKADAGGADWLAIAAEPRRAIAHLPTRS